MLLGSLGELPLAGEPLQVCFVPGPRLPLELEECLALGQDKGIGAALPPGLVADRQLSRRAWLPLACSASHRPGSDASHC